MTVPSSPPLPSDSTVVVDPSVRRQADGRVLLGGTPMRLFRLSEAGARVVDGFAAGEPVGAPSARARLARRLVDAGLAHPRPDSLPVVVAADVTVVVPVRDDPDRLDRLLGGLHDLAVVVVDDGSRDPAAHADVAERHGARLTRRVHSGGPGAARNTGLAEVSSELVAFIDADVVCPTAVVLATARQLGDPAVAAAAPRVVAADPTVGVLARYDRTDGPLDLGRVPSVVGPGRRVAYVPTAMLVARADVVRDVGGFDAALRFGEDVDLVWRVVAAGHIVRYDPDQSVTHAVRASWRAWVGQRMDYGRSAAELGRRHGAAVAPVRCSPWSLGVWVGGAFVHPAVGAVAAAVSTGALSRRLGELERPVADSVRLAGSGHLWAGRALARSVTRTWWPLAATAAMVSRRARTTVAVAALASTMVDWWRSDRTIDPVRYAGLRLADDLAYGTGVWQGVVRHRTTIPLRPEVVDWPGRRRAVEPATVPEP